MGFAVVVVDTNGTPVIPAETGVPAELATNGFGLPVILVERGGFGINIAGVVFAADSAGSYLVDHLGRYLVSS